MTSQFTKDLWMLQETLNTNFSVGSDQVRRSDIHMWLDPSSEITYEALREWQTQGFIAILADPRHCKENEVCLRILKRIEAVPTPDDLN
jgi:hypothetical protein